MNNDTTNGNHYIIDRSWDDFYESYDGKFDDHNMLHITVHSRFGQEIELLGYKLQNIEEDWHKPREGEYKRDDDGNLIVEPDQTPIPTPN